MRTLSLLGILCTFALLCSAPAADAQSLTFRGGLNLSKFVGGDAGENDTKTGLNLGAAFAPIRISYFSLVLEGYYRQKGAEGLQERLVAGTPTEPISVSIDYIEVPVLLRFDVPVGPSWFRPYLQGGPAFGWQIDCAVEIEAETGETEQACDDLFGSTGQLEETLKDFEQGLVFGGGVDLQVWRIGALNLDARLTRGLSRLSEGEDGPDVKNQSFTLMLGYSFGLGGMMGR